MKLLGGGMRSTNEMSQPARRWLVAIMVLAVVVRIAAALYLGESLGGAQQARAFDQVSYNALARSLLAGKGYTFEKDWYPFTSAGAPTAHWSFLYPLYLAGVYAIFGFHPLVARLIQAIVVGIVGTWLYYRLGRRLFNEKTGLVAAGLAAVYFYFVYYDVALMTEPFYILGILAMMDLSLSILDENTGSRGGLNGKWVVLGIILGITALLRQSILLWLPFHFAWMAWAGWKRLRWQGFFLATGVMMLFILPWTVRNYVVYQAFLPLNSNAGYALYSANHPHHGTQFDQDYAAPLPADLRGKGLNEAQWNNALIERGIDFVRQDLRRYTLLSLSRTEIFFNFWVAQASTVSGGVLRLLSFGLYLPFFIAGMAVSIRKWRRASLIYLFAVVYSLMHILTWASIRYRLPVDATLMPFAALAVVTLAGWLRARLGRVPAGKTGEANLSAASE